MKKFIHNQNVIYQNQLNISVKLNTVYLQTETLPSESDKATHCPQQPKKKLTVIAKHRRLGEESLSRSKWVQILYKVASEY